MAIVPRATAPGAKLVKPEDGRTPALRRRLFAVLPGQAAARILRPGLAPPAGM